MNRNKLKKYLLLYMASLEALSLTACTNKEEQSIESEITYNDNSLETPTSTNSKEIKSIKKVKYSKKSTKKEKINKEVKKEYNNIQEKINNVDGKKAKEKMIKEFINLVEFISGNKPIKGIYFNELDDITKKEITDKVKKLDKKIEKKYPNYKDPFKKKYNSVKKYIKENGIDKKAKKEKTKVVKETKKMKNKIKNKTKEKIGSDNYNKIGQKKDQLKEEVKESAEKGKQKVKKWYSDLKRKYQ